MGKLSDAFDPFHEEKNGSSFADPFPPKEKEEEEENKFYKS